MFLKLSFLLIFLVITEIPSTGETAGERASEEDHSFEEPHLYKFKPVKNVKKTKPRKNTPTQQHHSSENQIYVLKSPKGKPKNFNFDSKKWYTKSKSSKDEPSTNKRKNIFTKLWDKIKNPFTKDSSDSSRSKKYIKYKNRYKYYRKPNYKRGNYRRYYYKKNYSSNEEDDGNKNKKYFKYKWYTKRNSGTSVYKPKDKYFKHKNRFNKYIRDHSLEEKQNSNEKLPQKKYRQPIEHTYYSAEEHGRQTQAKGNVINHHSLESIHLNEDFAKYKPRKKPRTNNEGDHSFGVNKLKDVVIKKNEILEHIKSSVKDNPGIHTNKEHFIISDKKNNKFINVDNTIENHKNSNDKSIFNNKRHDDTFSSKELTEEVAHSRENTALNKKNGKRKRVPRLNSKEYFKRNYKPSNKNKRKNIIPETSKEKMLLNDIRKATSDNHTPHNPKTSFEKYSAEDRNGNDKLKLYKNYGNTIKKKKLKNENAYQKKKYKIDGDMSNNEHISVERNQEAFKTKQKTKHEKNQRNYNSLPKESKIREKSTENVISNEGIFKISKQDFVDGIKRTIANIHLTNQQSVNHNLPDSSQDIVKENINPEINLNDQSTEQRSYQKSVQENNGNIEFEHTTESETIPKEESTEIQPKLSEKKDEKLQKKETEAYKTYSETAISETELLGQQNEHTERIYTKPSDKTTAYFQEKTIDKQRNYFKDKSSRGDSPAKPYPHEHPNSDHTEQVILKTDFQNQIVKETRQSSLTEPEKYLLSKEIKVNKEGSDYANKINSQENIHGQNNNKRSQDSKEIPPLKDTHFSQSENNENASADDNEGQYTHLSSEKVDNYKKPIDEDKITKSKENKNIQGNSNKGNTNEGNSFLENSFEKDSKFNSLDNFIEKINEDKVTSHENGSKKPIKDDGDYVENKKDVQEVTLDYEKHVDVPSNLDNKELIQEKEDGNVNEEYEKELYKVQGEPSTKIPNIIEDTIKNEEYEDQHQPEEYEDDNENYNKQKIQEITNLEKPPVATGNEIMEGISEKAVQRNDNSDDDYSGDYNDEEEEEETTDNLGEDKPLFPNWYPKPPRNLFDRLFGISPTTASTPPSNHEKDKSEKDDYNYEDNKKQESESLTSTEEPTVEDQTQVPETTDQMLLNSSLVPETNSTQQPPNPDYPQQYLDENFQYYDSYEQFLANQKSDELSRYALESNTSTFRDFQDLPNQSLAKSSNLTNSFTGVELYGNSTLGQQNITEHNSTEMFENEKDINENTDTNNILHSNFNHTSANITNRLLSETNNTSLDYIYQDIENEINNLLNDINIDRLHLNVSDLKKNVNV